MRKIIKEAMLTFNEVFGDMTRKANLARLAKSRVEAFRNNHDDACSYRVGDEVYHHCTKKDCNSVNCCLYCFVGTEIMPPKEECRNCTGACLPAQKWLSEFNEEINSIKG